MVALKRLPTGTFSIMTSMDPAVAAIIGLIFLGEELSILQCFAMLLVIGASIGTSITVKPAASSLPD
jgi:inner membrane transporter RhtA